MKLLARSPAELVAAVRRRAVAAVAGIAAVRAELAVSGCLIGGWSLITHAIAQLLPHAPVWRLSAGLFLLSLTGWKFLFVTVAWRGLYALWIEEREAKDVKVRRG